MSSMDENFYSKISEIDGTKIVAEYTMKEIDDNLIPGATMQLIYDDTIFYLHLYNSLYIALLKYNTDNFNDVTKFKNVINNLKIKIDNSTAHSGNYDTVGELISRSVSSDFLFTFYASKCTAIYNPLMGTAQVMGRTTSAPSYTKGSATTLVYPPDIARSLIYKTNNAADTNYVLIATDPKYLEAITEYKPLYKQTPGSYSRYTGNFPTSVSDVYYILTTNLDSAGTPIPEPSYTRVTGAADLKANLLPYIYSTSDYTTPVASYPDFSVSGATYKMKYSPNTNVRSPTIYGSLNELKIGLLHRIYNGNDPSSSTKITAYPADGATGLSLYILTSDLDNSGQPKSGVTKNFSASAYTSTVNLENALKSYIYDADTDRLVSAFPTDFSTKKYYIKYSTLTTVSSSSYGNLADLETELKLRIYTKTPDTYATHIPLYTAASTYDAGGAEVDTVTTAFVSSRNSHYNTYITSANVNSVDTKYTPHLPNLLNTETAKSRATFVADTGTPSLYGLEFNKTYAFPNGVNNINDDIDITYNTSYRQNRLLYTIKKILANSYETMMGYLLYNKILYNIVLYNLEIQYIIRKNYLTSIVHTNKGTANYVETQKATIIAPVVDIIDKMKANIISLNTRLFQQDESDYVQKKYSYSTKYAALEAMKNDYNIIHNSLNRSVKDYNKYINNFISIKKYANYIIIFLIILIIITVIITILTNITEQFKNSYYIITLIILFIITYLFYNRFNHVNLYEKFGLGSTDNIPASSSSSLLTNEKNNNIFFVNNIAQNITDYNTKYKEIMSSLKQNIYTTDNQLFSAGADNYLYKLYIEKKNLNEANRLKKVSLTNLIEGMKKQILYLFNIILLLSCLTIILLLGLMLHSTYPFLIIYILILCSILVIITVIYFIFAIIQPTRMVANKNYWANSRPSENILSKL
jgi:hypothetical protein